MSNIDDPQYIEDKTYMRMALDQAREAARNGEVPIGAVVVYKPVDPETRRLLAPPRVIAAAGNVRERTHDPAGHAEFLALQEAARIFDAWRLSDCTVYVTLEPCLMCAGLMQQARITRCVYGTHDPKAGALGSLYAIHEDERLNHRFSVTSGILEEECADLLRTFFAEKRNHPEAAENGCGYYETADDERNRPETSENGCTPLHQQGKSAKSQCE